MDLPFYVVNFLAPLTVAALSGAFGWLWGKWHSQKKIEAAPRVFVNELDKLISRAYSEGPDYAIINARAIVSARNMLVVTLSKISIQLNSEIDRLAREAGETRIFERLSESVIEPKKPEPMVVYQTIQVLHKIWPAKKKQIEVEIRSILAILGLNENGEKVSRNESNT